MKNSRWLFVCLGLVLTLVIFSFGVVAGYFIPNQVMPYVTTALAKQPLPFGINKQDVNLLFLLEVYDKIKQNYWEDLTDQQLAELFKKAADKLAPRPQELTTLDKQGLKVMFTKMLRGMDEGKRREFVVNLASTVLSNLRPVGRSGLITQKLETNLKNIVQNINPDKDLYKDLGVGKDAPPEKVEEVFREESKKLESEKHQAKEPEKKAQIQQKIEQITYAREVLGSADRRERYDTYGIEPTVFTSLVTSGVLHLHIRKMSPTTFDEFQKAVASFDREDGPEVLAFDLRGNIGGALDIIPLLTGAFLGKNQHSFDLFNKGKYEAVRTTVDKLPGLARYKEVVVLVDEMGQSSAEITAATLKRYNIGVVVGKKTKGWGTVERVYPLDNQITADERYSLFLVNNITLRDDGQPIEGRGVEPTVSIDDPDWDRNLSVYVRSGATVNAVKEILGV